jgi:hypothetical protein
MFTKEKTITKTIKAPVIFCVPEHLGQGNLKLINFKNGAKEKQVLDGVVPFMSPSVLSDADIQISLAEVRLETSTGVCSRRKRTSRAVAYACMRQWSMPYLQ